MNRAWRTLAVLCFGLGVAEWLHAGPFAYIPDGRGVTVIDVATNTALGAIAIPGGAAGEPVATLLNGPRAYVARGGTIFAIDTRAQASIGSIDAATSPSQVVTRLALHPTRPVLYAGLDTDAAGVARGVIEIDTDRSSGGIALTTDAAVDLQVSADGSRLYVLEQAALKVFDTAARRLLSSFALPADSGALAIHPRLDRAYVSRTLANQVLVIDLATGGTLATIVTQPTNIGQGPRQMVLDAGGTRLYIANTGSDTVSFVDTATNTVNPVAFGDRLPSGIDITPAGDRLYIVDTGSDSVRVIGAQQSAVPLATIAVGPHPVAVGKFIGGETTAHRPDELTGLWWNPAQSGWGVHVAHRGSKLFAAWFTYSASGTPKWYVSSDCSMSSQLPCPACSGAAICSGSIYETTGPRFFADPYNPGNVAVNRLGLFQMVFTDRNTGTMSFVIGDVARTFTLRRQVFREGSVPATDYTDLWWNPLESGWGVGITQQAGTMFLAWFAYDDSGSPAWLVASNCAVNASGDGCTGDLYRTSGPADPLRNSFDSSRVRVNAVGSITVTFTDANSGIMSYTVDGKSGTKAIVRQVF